uniref:Uncharacterized protein n=1 Tax=Mycena chlorophos TaxID=658473 RepID=A0ABQ0L680_MYCCL|nr:predicted protein [Mycena chlorophos]
MSQEPEDVKPKLNLKIVYDGEGARSCVDVPCVRQRRVPPEVTIKVKPNTKFGKIFQAAEVHITRPRPLRATHEPRSNDLAKSPGPSNSSTNYEGKRVSKEESDTPAGLDVEDGDQIDCLCVSIHLVERFYGPTSTDSASSTVIPDRENLGRPNERSRPRDPTFSIGNTPYTTTPPSRGTGSMAPTGGEKTFALAALLDLFGLRPAGCRNSSNERRPTGQDVLANASDEAVVICVIDEALSTPCCRSRVMITFSTMPSLLGAQAARHFEIAWRRGRSIGSFDKPREAPQPELVVVLRKQWKTTPSSSGWRGSFCCRFVLFAHCPRNASAWSTANVTQIPLIPSLPSPSVATSRFTLIPFFRLQPSPWHR